MERRSFINLIPAIGLAGSTFQLSGINLQKKYSVKTDSREN